MKVNYDSSYGADRDGNRGEPMWEADLNDSIEEREEIVDNICKDFSEDGEINLDRFDVTIIHVDYSNCRYNEEYDETFCEENEVEFNFNVSPIDYMDLAIPRLLEQIDGWGVDKMSSLLYLEKDLIEAKYKGEELNQLTKAVEPFREILGKEI